jgi:hypothetical protein
MSTSKFDEVLRSFGLLQEQNIADLQSDTHIPTTGTEVKIVANAQNHPMVKAKGEEFQKTISELVADGKKKTCKYRLIISNVKTIRGGTTDVVSSPVGHVVTITKQIGPVMKGHIELPLELVKVVNASWNQNSSEIPEEWKQNMEKYSAFNNIIKGYFEKGIQPKGTLANP